MEYKRGNLISIHFDSMAELLDNDDVTRGADQRNARMFHSHMRRREGSRVYGPTCNSTRDCLNFAIEGDHALYDRYLLEKISTLDNEVQFEGVENNIGRLPVIKRRRTRSDFGDELDIHAVNQGRLDRAWQTTERIEFDQEHHFITILIDIGGAWKVNAPDTLWVAAACLKVCNDIERAGKHVQIIVGGIGIGGTRFGKNVSVTACVKRYNETLNVERLAAMSHLGFFRAFCFLGFYTCSEEMQPALGTPGSFHNYMPIPLSDEIAEGMTKLVIMEKALNLQQAVNSIKSANQQILKMGE